MRALASALADLVAEAEAPINPFSSRDGKLLRLVPKNERLDPQQLRGEIEKALVEHEEDVLSAAQQYTQQPRRRGGNKAAGACFLALGLPFSYAGLPSILQPCPLDP